MSLLSGLMAVMRDLSALAACRAKARTRATTGADCCPADGVTDADAWVALTALGGSVAGVVIGGVIGKLIRLEIRHDAGRARVFWGLSWSKGREMALPERLTWLI